MSQGNSSSQVAALSQGGQASLFGHPVGLYTLFFAEMWERFSYYGMRALLIFYMTKGFLGYGDKQAYAVYGAYGALVYATPFIGGMLADRLLGARKAVVLGGMLMAAGHLLMTMEHKVAFFGALALLIVGNGFFKPNISTIVGSLYDKERGKRDAGFTIFYIGINLGAAIAPLLCGYIGETYGWHYGFGLATIGMLTGLAVFVAPARVTQALIVMGALAAAGSMFWFNKGDKLMLSVNAPVGIALIVAAFVAAAAVGKGGVPKDAGRPTKVQTNARMKEMMVYGGTLLSVPLLAFLVGKNEIAGYCLTAFGVVALGTILFEALRSNKVERERLFVVLILMFFSMLFWAFFEQAGSSVNNFTDRNVDRVVSGQLFTQEQVGKTIDVPANQALVGLKRPNGAIVNIREIEGLNETFRKEHAEEFGQGARPTISWTVTPEHVGQQYGGSEVKASVFQAVNPVCIMVFGLIFSSLWGYLGKRKMEPSTPVKFSLGLLQLGLGFGVFWYGASHSTDRGMTMISFLVLGYALHTTGELCLSPVGLSMVTSLSPRRMVSTVMGGWFLATAFSNYLAGLIATLTGVGHGEESGNALPPPQESVGVYGDVFGKIAIAGIASAVLVFAISPLLRKWMHPEVDNTPATTGGGH